MKMSIYSHESMINHHGSGLFAQLSENLPHLAAALPDASRTGPMVRSRPARCRPVLERYRPRGRKAVLAGLNKQPGRRRLFGGAGHRLFGTDGSPAMIALRLNDLRQHSDILRLRNGKSADGAFCRAGRRGRLAGLLPVALGPLPLQSLSRRHERAAANRTRSFHPCRRGRPLQRDRDHDDRWL